MGSTYSGTALLRVLLLLLCFWDDVLSVDQPSDAIPGIVPPARGNRWLHMDKFMIYTYNDLKYVRLYMTIFKPLPIGGDGSPEQAFKHKDIWLSNEGHVIIKSDTKGACCANSGDGVMKFGLTLDESPLWVSLGKVRHQIEFLHKYRAQNKGAQPLIRSWLVKYEAVQAIMDPHYMTTEPFSTTLNLDVNVDLHTPNQFGLKPNSIELLRRNALPNSLVTYTDEDRNSYPKSWGKIVSVEDLRRQFGLPLEDVPGIHHLDDSKGRSAFLAGIADNLEEIKTMYQRQGFSTDVEQKVQNYNNEYSTTIGQNDLEKFPDWIAEARRIKQINDNYYDRSASEHGAGKWIKLSDNDMVAIKHDHMFHGFTDDIDVKIAELKDSSQSYGELLDKRNKLFQLAEAVVAEVNHVLTNDPTRSRDLHFYRRRRKLGEHDQISPGALKVFQDAEISSAELNKIKLGIDLTDSTYEQNRNKITNKILMPNELTVDENIKRQIGIGYSDDDISFLRSKGIPESFLLSQDGSGDILYIHGEQRRSATPVMVDSECIITAVSSNGDWDRLPDIINSYIVGEKISELNIISQGKGFRDQDFFTIQKINRGRVRSDKFFLEHRYLNFEWDAIGNRVIVNEAGLGTRSGTLVQFYEGHPVHHNRLFEIDDVSEMRTAYGSRFSELQKKKFTGFELLDFADPIPDNRYMYLQSDKPTDKPVSVSDFVDRVHAVQVESDVEVGKKKHAYIQELLIQVGVNEESVKATKFLYDTYRKQNGKRVYQCGIDINGNFQSVEGDLKSCDFRSRTRVHFIGHGEGSGNSLLVAGFSAKQLVDSFVTNVLNTEDATFISKISIIACNMDATEQNQRAVEIGLEFGKEFLAALHKHDANAELSIRTGEIQVDDMGRKQYKYKLKGNVYDWRYRHGDPALVRIDASGNLKYGKRTNNGRISWSTQPSKQIDKTRKIVLIAEQNGNFDLAGDIKPGKYHAIEPAVEASGPLRALMYDNSLEHPYFLDEIGYKAVSVQTESSYWANRLLSATDEVLFNLPDPKSWVPIIDSVEVDSEGHTKVTLLNSDTNEQRSVTMKSNAYTQFKKRSQRAISVSKLNTPHNSMRFTLGAGSIMGLSFFINSAVEMSRLRNCRADGSCVGNGSASSLAMALQVHAYTGLAQGSFGAVTDSIEIASVVKSVLLARRAVNGVVTTTKHTMRFLKVATAVGKVATGVGVVGGAVSLGFSAFELHHAQTKAQKVQFGIQVGLESAGLAITGVMITASLMGASWAGGPVAGAVGFAVGIATMLINGLVSLGYEFKDTRNNARIVGEYFYDLNDVYSKGGFHFNRSDNTLSILPHAIVEYINIEGQYILLGSQYIYRTRHGKTGSGKINYFFWYKDFPTMIEDKYQAINIREGIGYVHLARLDTINNLMKITLVLPIVPKSYISYTYKRLPFCTAMHDKGFDVARRLENDHRFDYDFYIVPGEQIVNSISHEYVETVVRVKLTHAVQVVVIPEYPEMLQGFYKFSLESSGTEHYVVLNAGVQLSFKHNGRGVCKWIVDVRSFSDTYRFVGNTFKYGSKTSLSFVGSSNQELQLVDSSGGWSTVDLTTGRRRVSHVTVPREQTINELIQYLKKISAQLTKDQKFIILRNLTVSSDYIGNAFYEVANERVLYTNTNEADVSESFKDSVTLLGMTGQRVFYMGKMGNYFAVWWTHTINHTVGASFQFYCGNDGYDITPIGMSEQSVILAQTVENVSLIYRATHDALLLLSIDGTRENVDRLADVCFPSLSSFLPQNSAHQFPGDCVYARSLPVLPLITTTPDMVHHHYWLFMEDTKPSTDYQEGVFCNPSEPPVTTGIVVPNLPEPECIELALRGMLSTPDGGTVYLFFCDEHETKKGYAQIDNNTATVIDIPDGVHSIVDSYVPSVFVRSHNGGLYAFEESGNFSLAAVSISFLEKSLNWKDSLLDLIDKSDSNNRILVLGLQTNAGTPVKAWFEALSEKFVIFSPSLQNIDDIMYLAESNNPQYVWLYDTNNGNLLLQTIMSADEIEATVVRTSSVRWGSEIQPQYHILHEGLVSVEYTAAGNVLGITDQGVMLSFNEYKYIKLLGVNSTWVSSHQRDIINELVNVCARYMSHDLITLGMRDINGTHSEWRWFFCSTSKLLSLCLERDINPIFLGTNFELGTAYFSDERHLLNVSFASSDRRYRRSVIQDLPTSHQSQVESIEMATRAGDTLLIKSAVGMDLRNIPLLDEVSSLVISPSGTGSEITISREVWVHYKNIIFSTSGTDGYLRTRLFVEAPYPCDYPYTEKANSTVFVDVISDHKLVLEDFTLRNKDRTTPENPAILVLHLCNSKSMYFMSNEDRPVPEYNEYQHIETSNMTLVVGIAFAALTFGICVCGVFCRLLYRRRQINRRKRKAGKNHKRNAKENRKARKGDSTDEGSETDTVV